MVTLSSSVFLVLFMGSNIIWAILLVISLAVRSGVSVPRIFKSPPQPKGDGEGDIVDASTENILSMFNQHNDTLKKRTPRVIEPEDEVVE